MIDLRFPRGPEEIRVISDHSTFQSSQEYAPHCICQEFNPKFCETFFVWKDKKLLGLKYFYLDVMMMTPFAQCAGAQHLVHQAESEF